MIGDSYLKRINKLKKYETIIIKFNDTLNEMCLV